MFKRVALHALKKSVDTEKEAGEESAALSCSHCPIAPCSDGGLVRGHLRQSDLSSAEREADGVAGGAHQLVDDELTRTTARSRVFLLYSLEVNRMEFKPRALTRRLCGGRKHDNELYRSNSFKFERFERTDDGSSLQKQVSLCDEYSLPVDFVNKRRPHSFGAGLANWTTPSPSGDQVEVVEAYCDPRDSKAYLEPGEEASGKLYTSPDRDYSQPYTDGSSEAKAPEVDDNEDGVYEDVGQPEDKVLSEVIPVAPTEEVTDERPQQQQAVRRNPSPYYYSDLFRDSDPGIEVSRRPAAGSRYRKCVSLDDPPPPAEVPVLQPKRNSVAGDGSDTLVALERTAQHAESSLLQWDTVFMPPHRQVRQQHLPSVCACAGAAQCVRDDDDIDEEESAKSHLPFRNRDVRLSNKQQPPIEEPPVDYDDPDAEEDEDDDYCDDMSGRQRHLYETAFDCKVNRSDDDLDEVDRVTNHPILQMFGTGKMSSSNVTKPVRPGSSKDPGSLGIFTPKERRKVTLIRGKLMKDRPKPIANRMLHVDNASSTTTLSQDLEGLELDDSELEKPAPSPPLPLRGYSPSPPSTAPLPAKFHGNKDLHVMNSIRSAPNIPSGSPAHPRIKDMRLPVKSLRARESPGKGSIMEFKGRPLNMSQDDENVQEFKGRPQSMFQEGAHILEFKDRPRVASEHGLIIEFKGRPRSAAAELDYSGRCRNLLGQESGPIQEFKGRPSVRRCGVRPKYSSTESMATSSSGGSLESIRSSTSEGNRSTTSSESHRSSSLSSHSSDSTSSGGSTTGNLHHFHHLHHFYHHHHHQCSSAGTPLGVASGGRFFAHQSNKLHILSPISDKSSQEPASETSDNNRNNNSQRASPEDSEQFTSPVSTTKLPMDQSWSEQLAAKVKRRAPQNKNVINLSLQQQSSAEVEIQGSDSGISIESRGGTKGCKNHSSGAFGVPDHHSDAKETSPGAEFSDLPFDMPKLRRRRLLQQDTCTSGSATSVDLHDLPFDMPKLRRRLRGQQEVQTSTESSGVSQASSSQSVQDADRQSVAGGIASRPTLSLNLDTAGGGSASPKKRLGLCLNLGGAAFAAGDAVEVDQPLERQGWYHGAITRLEAENILRLHQEGSYLVRNSESTRQDYSLSLKSARGFMHMRIQQNKETGKFILGQFSKPFDNIPEMIHHYTINRLPIRGAEHMCLLHPVIEQLL